VSASVWHPLSGIDYTGRLCITLPAQSGGAIALYVGDSMRLDLEASGDDDTPLTMTHERLVSGPGVSIPPDFWLEDGSPMEAPRYVSYVMIDAAGDHVRSFVLSLGRRAPRVLARLVNFPRDVHAPVCAETLPREAVYFATGWYGQESDAREGHVRWMRAQGAVLLSSADGRASRVRVRVAPPDGETADAETQLSIRVNDVLDLEPFALRAGFQEYELNVPDAAWAPGTNELLFTVSRTRTEGTRTRGLALASLDVR
jgi:hypothetical protein